MRPVIHHKTGNIYIYIDEIANCTNSASNELMILYMNLLGIKFVREKSEFWIKFGDIDHSDIKHIDRSILKFGEIQYE